MGPDSPVNARGPFLLTLEVARAIVAKGDGGRIVNIASTVLRGQIVRGHAPYAGSKGSLVGLSPASALELMEHGITVNTVLPGGGVTPGFAQREGAAGRRPARRMPPLGLCEPHDIGAAVYFFTAPAVHRVSNQVLAVDGGFSLS